MTKRVRNLFVGNSCMLEQLSNNWGTDADESEKFANNIALRFANDASI